jgi:hypothetical protein
MVFDNILAGMLSYQQLRFTSVVGRFLGATQDALKKVTAPGKAQPVGHGGELLDQLEGSIVPILMMASAKGHDVFSVVASPCSLTGYVVSVAGTWASARNTR